MLKGNAEMELLNKADMLLSYLKNKSLKESDYPSAMKKWYKKVTGRELNLENPRTYDEKIQWLKVNDSTRKKARLADKYLVRKWIEKKLGKK